MKKEIHGLEGDKCKTTEQMPNNGKMTCKFSKIMRKAAAKFLEKAAKAKKSSTKFSTSGGTTTKLDGKKVKDPLNKALTDGTCVISGY